MIEIWKDIEGYEGLYQVSNLGRVRSLDRYVNSSVKKGFAFRKGRIIKPYYGNYVSVELNKCGHGTTKNVHRLVATAFLPNPNNYPMINHKDEDKTNNCVENLEWCDASYNNAYNGGILKRARKHKKPIIGFDGVHRLGTYFQSAVDASTFTGIRNTDIYSCLNGKIKTTHGWKWERVND